jgi:hypothetical protein
MPLHSILQAPCNPHSSSWPCPCQRVKNTIAPSTHEAPCKTQRQEHQPQHPPLGPQKTQAENLQESAPLPGPRGHTAYTSYQTKTPTHALRDTWVGCQTPLPAQADVRLLSSAKVNSLRPTFNAGPTKEHEGLHLSHSTIGRSQQNTSLRG